MDPEASVVEPGGELEGQAGAPEIQPEAGQPESPTQSQPDQQSIQLTPELIDKLLQDPQAQQRIIEAEPVKRFLQSQKDREIARERRRLLEEQRRREEQARRQAEEEELRRLLAQGNYEEYGKRKAVYDLQAQQQFEIARQISAVVEQALVEDPEFQELGEDTIQSIYQDVASRNGTVADFAKALAKAKAERHASAQLESKKQEILNELRAQLVEQGALARSEQAQSDGGIVPSVSTTVGGARAMTPDEARQAYIDGLITAEQYAKLDPSAFR